MSQLATVASELLTKCYRALYGSDTTHFTTTDSVNESVLSLRTAPLAASEEVVSLFRAQLIPCSVAVSSSMHTLGVPPEQIDEAVEELTEQHKRQMESMMQGVTSATGATAPPRPPVPPPMPSLPSPSGASP